MSYPEQRDYGTENGKALVPGTLTVFRHVLLDTSRGIIAPMGWTPYRPSYRESTSPAKQPYPRPQLGDVESVSLTHVAECASSTPYVGRAHEKSPTEWCTCGFYAHYDPATDFYPSYRWGRAYAQASGEYEAAGLVVARAVVEVSGTVVMGRLGVRAEKMKIVALAIDWEKQMTSQPPGRRRTARLPAPDAWGDLYHPAFDEGPDLYYYEDNEAWEQKQADDNRFTEETVSMIAHRYRVKFYTEPGRMYADHPKADISALGVDTTPRPTTRRADFDFKLQLNQPISIYTHQVAMYHAHMASLGFQAAAQQLASAAQVTSTTVRGWYDEMIRAENAKPKRKPKRDQLSVPQAVQDVIDARASRPAPPGAGIDRRRGRLR